MSSPVPIKHDETTQDPRDLIREEVRRLEAENARLSETMKTNKFRIRRRRKALAALSDTDDQ